MHVENNFYKKIEIFIFSEIVAQNSACIFGSEALAKILTNENKEFYIKEGVHEVSLGREKQLTDDYFQIGENNTISKRHARIFWD